MPDITIDKLHVAAILPLGYAHELADSLNAEGDEWYYEAEHMAADVARVAVYNEEGEKVGYL